MNPTTQAYFVHRDAQARENIRDTKLQKAVNTFTDHAIRTNWTKMFSWMGRPILQYPTDLIVLQELIWQIKPDYIIESGVAFGGMLVFYASILESIGHGQVIGIDIDIRKPNRQALDDHPLRRRICLIEGDSIAEDIVDEVTQIVSGSEAVMVCLDSHHTHDHVLAELKAYSPLVTVGSYLVVFDTALEHWAEKHPPVDRPWGVGNNPLTAVKKFLKTADEFMVDHRIEGRALLTAAPGGWLRKMR